MNIYLIGMIIAMAVFVLIGLIVSKKIKNAEDFYVAGRQAPVLLITGSLVASYSSTGMFMGDAATCYDGAFTSILLYATMQTAGYIFGAVFFGRYIRRSKALTMPEFFGNRFNSKSMRGLSAITAILTMTVYLLSVMMGIGTLMEIVTGVDYRICIIIAMVVFTIISVTSGSRGVLITDTLMAAVFTVAIVLGVIFIAKGTGGWFDTIENLAADSTTSSLLSWGGKPGVLGELYKSGKDNILWGLVYGIIWSGVCAFAPWQASRYQMAKNEHVIVKSSVWSAVGVFALEFLSGIAAIMVRRVFPDMPDSSHVLIWASMNLMPKVLGVILLTGILAAGISSATTFQSLIGASISNDIIKTLDVNKGVMSDEEIRKTDRKAINIGRIAMIIIAVIVLVVAVINPPAIFIIMILGASLISSSWMPVAVASVFWKRLTKTGAFIGMLSGFVGTFALKLAAEFGGMALPSYLDPCIIGVFLNVIGMIIGSLLTKVTPEEEVARKRMFVIPESEKDPAEVKKTLKFTKIGLLAGAVITVALLVLWVIPYLIGSNM